MKKDTHQQFYIPMMIQDVKQSGYKTFAIYQGDLTHLGTVDELITLFSSYDIVLLTHVANLPPPRGWQNNGKCQDVKYPHIDSLVRGLKHKATSLGKTIEIYGYVAAIADLPYAWSDYPTNGLLDTEDARAPGMKATSEAQANCNNAVTWIELWRELEIDGIFLDMAAPEFITSNILDNCLSYIKAKEMKLMVNICGPAISNAQFVINSSYLTPNDYIYVEGGFMREGISCIEDTSAVINYIKASNPNYRVAIQAQESEEFPNKNNCDTAFNAFSSCTTTTTKDAFSYTQVDLGCGNASSYVHKPKGAQKVAKYLDAGFFDLEKRIDELTNKMSTLTTALETEKQKVRRLEAKVEELEQGIQNNNDEPRARGYNPGFHQ